MDAAFETRITSVCHGVEAIPSLHSPWVEFVYDALEPYDCEQTSREAGHPCQEENGERDEAFPSGRVGQQRFHTDISVRRVVANSNRHPGELNPYANITGNNPSFSLLFGNCFFLYSSYVSTAGGNRAFSLRSVFVCYRL